jgi:type II secretory pathway pseudopilin PulG
MQFSLKTLLLVVTIVALASLAVSLQLKLNRVRTEAARAQELAAKRAAIQAQLNARLAQQRQAEEMQLRMRGLGPAHPDANAEQRDKVFRLPHFVQPQSIRK